MQIVLMLMATWRGGNDGYENAAPKKYSGKDPLLNLDCIGMFILFMRFLGWHGQTCLSVLLLVPKKSLGTS